MNLYKMIENVAAKPKVQATSIRALVVSKNPGPAAMETDNKSYNDRLASLKKRFDQTKAARMQRNLAAMEEASFLERITHLELKEKKRMEGIDSESNESLMNIDE